MSIKSLKEKANKLYDKEEYEKAFALFSKICKKDWNDQYAAYTLGVMYAFGQGTEKDLAKAVGYFSAANTPKVLYPDGLYWMSLIMRDGKAVKADVTGALHNFERAGEAGHVDSMYEAGYMYANGRGTEKSLTAAADWMEKAAAKGHEQAKAWLSKYDTDVKNARREADKMAKIAAEQAEKSRRAAEEAKRQAAEHAEQEKQTAIRKFKEQVESGEVDAILKNAERVLDKYNWSKKESVNEETKAAVEQIKELAEIGYAAAQCSLGRLYFYGRYGVPRNESTARELMREAASRGNYEAQEFLDWEKGNEKKAADYKKQQAEKRQRSAEDKNYSPSGSSSSSSKPMSEGERRDWKYTTGYDRTNK